MDYNLNSTEDLNVLEATVAKNSLKYLSNIDTFLNNFENATVLRSYCLQKFKKREAQQKLNLPTKLIKPTAKCPKCYVTRTLGSTKYQICKRPQQCRFYRRLSRKVLSLKRLSPFQRANAHKVKNYLANKLVIHCQICNTKSEEILNKSSASGTPPHNTKGPIEKKKTSQLVDSKKDKGNSKNKNKDVNCRIAKNKAKTAKKFSTMLASKPDGTGRSSSLKAFLKSL